jgi:hypothetical protein
VGAWTSTKGWSLSILLQKRNTNADSQKRLAHPTSKRKAKLPSYLHQHHTGCEPSHHRGRNSRVVSYESQEDMRAGYGMERS